MNLKSTLKEPFKPNSIPSECQWLAGEGAGSWFYLQKNERGFHITRYSPKGRLECQGVFTCSSNDFDVFIPFSFVHLSHCQQVTILQNNKTYILERLND